MASELTDGEIVGMKVSFEFFDKNGDGSISARELADTLRGLGQNPTRKEIKEMMTDAGKLTEDDEISFDEFVKLMEKYSKSANDQREEFLDAFAVFDTNGDGYITADELRDMMLNLGEKLDDEQVQEMLAQADTDGDGRISYEEFVDMMMKP